MRKYVVEMVNSKSGTVGKLTVDGCSCSDAGAEAREKLSKYGFDIIKNIACIA